ncbi:hypothetical protein AMTR_s00136p00064180 [Amborella trichopoda]|uniref:Uncharacterized protein n=1 Tax=Amborella trichopoda TaxID=13333 RepID=W1NFL1_AMBTC|nr:hypothetical protein AMTR_s00136p00064180 [Amborella trichopoda]
MEFGVKVRDGRYATKILPAPIGGKAMKSKCVPYHLHIRTVQLVVLSPFLNFQYPSPLGTPRPSLKATSYPTPTHHCASTPEEEPGKETIQRGKSTSLHPHLQVKLNTHANPAHNKGLDKLPTFTWGQFYCVIKKENNGQAQTKDVSLLEERKPFFPLVSGEICYMVQVKEIAGGIIRLVIYKIHKMIGCKAEPTRATKV